jgi:hypothetical protein
MSFQSSTPRESQEKERKLSENKGEDLGNVPFTAITSPIDESPVTKSKRQRMSDLFTIVLNFLRR